MLTCHLGDGSAEVSLVHSRLPYPQLASLRPKHAVDLVKPAHMNGSPQPFCMHVLISTPFQRNEADQKIPIWNHLTCPFAKSLPNEGPFQTE